MEGLNRYHDVVPYEENVVPINVAGSFDLK
jgi:protein tyrosine phosphatase